ncbi:hypothetical protein Hypma_015555 [Hypsizygus marmoreus]|uniref:Uncharacterized protein n=1 Tax=Hypsizygus marmoreus TaxID=39966 RepID=A0A369K3F2_HYPMA|nr:hypothetical protein Hypma_015555 [Hypsizygus marmoreus]
MNNTPEAVSQSPIFLVSTVSLKAPSAISGSLTLPSEVSASDEQSHTFPMTSPFPPTHTKSSATVSKPPSLPIATMSDGPETSVKSVINAPAASSSSSSEFTPPTNTHTSAASNTTKATPSLTVTQTRPPLQPSHDATPSPPKTTSIQEIKATKSTRTSTITDHPVSTFSSPVAVPVTDNSNGRVTLTTPAAITVLSTSTEPEGEFVTYTHVIANPSGFSSGIQTKSSGFLANHGAVAGVFLVVGITAAAVGLCLLLLLRRRLRRNRRDRWLAEMHPQPTPPSNPFEDPQQPQMRTPDENHRETTWEGRNLNIFDDTKSGHLHYLNVQRGLESRIGTGYTNPSRVTVPSEYPPDDHNEHRAGNIGLVHLFSRVEDITPSRASIAQSSPSIYPASLPPTGDDDSVDAMHYPTDESDSTGTNLIGQAPPRPPKSHLRRSVTKSSGMYPMTPPPSASSHSHSNPPSPITEETYAKTPRDNVWKRRTLLDVRPRPNHEYVTDSL